MKTGMDLPHPPAVLEGGPFVAADQRRLPTETVYLELTRPEEVREAIRELAVSAPPSGSPPPTACIWGQGCSGEDEDF